MNTRILRMCQRSPIKGCNIRRVAGLGQMQPVLFGIEHGTVRLRIEDAQGGRPCWAVLPLPQYKARAKALFRHLEHCKATGQRSAASQAWEAK